MAKKPTKAKKDQKMGIVDCFNRGRKQPKPDVQPEVKKEETVVEKAPAAAKKKKPRSNGGGGYGGGFGGGCMGWGGYRGY